MLLPTNTLLMTDPLRLVRPNILALEPYATARDEFDGGDISVWLDANESPYTNGVNRYPDPHQKELKKAIARLKGVDEACIFVGGAGSDEAIDLTYRIFCRPGIDNAVAISPSYGVYRVAAAINDVKYREVMLADDFTLDTDSLLAATDANTRLIWICSPNNPTGNAFDTDDLEALADRFDGILVVDEAYVDFSTRGTMLSALARHRNLIVLQTFSKAWGMAGLRTGMAFACPEIAALYGRVKYPYNLNGPTQREVMSRIADGLQGHVEEIRREAVRLSRSLSESGCVEKVYPTDANFLLVKVSDADAVYHRLIESGILVRNRSSMAGCEGCLRVTVGTPAENDLTIEAFARIGRGDAPLAKRPERKGSTDRTTSETSIEAAVNLDRSTESAIDTGLKFLDHMLWQIPHHAGIGVRLTCKGDLYVDEHHTMEDVAIALGDAMREALGDKRGIERYGFVLPMDESRAMVLIDLGGRIDLEWDVEFTREYVGDTPTEMFGHFFKSLATAMRCNLHISARGENNHHLAEAIFKAFARALKAAVRRDPFNNTIASSKGVI